MMHIISQKSYQYFLCIRTFYQLKFRKSEDFEYPCPDQRGKPHEGLVYFTGLKFEDTRKSTILGKGHKSIVKNKRKAKQRYKLIDTKSNKCTK